MQIAVPKSAHLPQSQIAMLGILLFAVTAYPKSLDQQARNVELAKPAYAQCVAQLEKMSAAPHS